MARWSRALLAIAGIVGVGSAIAVAAIYIPGPLPASFGPVGTAFVPPTLAGFVAEQRVHRAIAKLEVAASSCFVKGAGRVAQGQPSGVDACLGTGDPQGRGALDKFEAALIRSGAESWYSACLHPAQGSAIVGVIKVFNPVLFCEGAPLPPEFGAGFLPADPTVRRAVMQLAQARAQLAAGLVRCYAAGAKRVTRGQSDGLGACLGSGTPTGTGALDRFAKAAARIGASPGDLSPCIDVAGLATATAGEAQTYNAFAYCFASPSGAFLDGPATY